MFYMVTTINNNTMVVNEFPSNQIVSLFKHATIWDHYTCFNLGLQYLYEENTQPTGLCMCTNIMVLSPAGNSWRVVQMGALR
jgi:hypothetical protein